MEVRRLEEEAPAEALVPGDGLDDALGGLERAVDDMDECDRGAERRAVMANRLTVCTAYCVKAPTVSGVRSANFPKPPRRIPRPSGRRLTDIPARGE